MKTYAADTTKKFDKNYAAQKKNPQLCSRVKEKMREICKNPHHYKSLRNILKNQRRVHISSFVLTFEIQEANKIVIFHRLQHHDTVYKK